MPWPLSLLVHRGDELPLPVVHRAAMELLGGHLRPDAELAVQGSALVRVQRGARTQGDPLAGTVHALHFTVPDDSEGLLTDLSQLVLPPRMGFGEEGRAGWEHFGHNPIEALALKLSERTGPVAVLASADAPELAGSYALFGSGRRIWSACFRPGRDYTTWDGHDLRVEAMEPRDPTPPEGGHDSFAAHGLQLLFGEPLKLTERERMNLLPTLAHASRPPTEGARGALLVRGGVFEPAGTALSEEDLARFTRSFVS